MATFIKRSVLLLSLAASSVLAQDSGPKCSPDSQCPEDTPCCSQYGTCGVGAYCLGGCDPVSSFSLDACVPMPVCKDYSKSSFNDLNDFVKQDNYLGDSTDAPWVYSGEPVTTNGELWLTMAEGTVGTLIKSTTFMWYGRIEASIRVSPGAGVVTAFIALGDSKDEIDFEWIGVEQVSTQTNFYNQGVTNYNNVKNLTGQPNVVNNFHDYAIDWTPDTITWYVDGKNVRELDRESTWNATAGRYSYPQTPCQIQLSLWPAGLPTNGQGTIEWGGGLVDWNNQDAMTNGYYHADFKNIKTQCYDPPKGAKSTGDKSYIFTDRAMTNDTVEITDKDTVLGSFQATGLNMDFGKEDDSKNTTGSIPGQSGGGPSTANHEGDDATSSDGGSGSSGTTSGEGTSTTGFVQGNGGMDNGAPSQGAPEQIMQGSLFAALVAIIGLCVL